MNEYDVRRYAQICAINAEIQGMIASNKMRELRGMSLAYGDRQFGDKAEQLRNLAASHNDQL